MSSSKVDWSKIDWSQFPLPPGFERVSLVELRASHNEWHSRAFQQFVRDGAEVNGILENRDNIPSLYMRIERTSTPHSVWLTPKMEQFVLHYLFTGDNSDYPKQPPTGILPEFRAGDDYIDRHIKRELERGNYICSEETLDGITGIRFIGKYPYGSINYGFIPCSFEELKTRLENVEAFHYGYPEYDIPELHYNNKLPIEVRELAQGEYLDSALDAKVIPTNAIIDKTICGVGATWLEIHYKRKSIIIEPNVPVIIGKVQQHPKINIIGVYGETLKSKDIAEKIQNQPDDVKIMTTPDSYWKVQEALKSINPLYYNDYFLLFDECEKIVSDIDYRPNIALPIDDFFRFKDKAMVSATPIVINDPRFERQGFKIIKIRPQFDYRQLLELKPTNNVNAMVKRTFQKIDKDSMICFFYNSVKGIEELIYYLGIGEQANIYCSTDARKELRRKDYPRVFDSITNSDGKPTLGKYNFFTSRFYSAVDIILDNKPIVIMITEVYKTKTDRKVDKAVKYRTPYSLIDPETEAIQIAGRFRNGIERLIHITDTNSKLEFRPREELEQFLNEEHVEFLKLLKLHKEAETDGGKHITWQAVTKSDYFAHGYVSVNGEVNYFRYNNAYLDERLKMLYTYPAPLNKAYKRSGAFTVISESVYAIYTDEERRKLENGTKAEKIELLNDLLKRDDDDSLSGYDYLFIQEQKRKYAFWIEALMTIGFARMKELGFVDLAIKTEIKDITHKREATNPKVIKEVYKSIKSNATYPTSEINEHLKRIFDSHKIAYDGRGVGKSIFLYFEAEESRTGRERVWKLGNRLY